MLNDTTKRKINSLRDILVGKIPDPKSQVEQITNALIYKYMDDMDRQSEAMGGKASFFAGEYKKYSWRSLMDSKMGGQERMNLYIEALGKMGTNKKLSPIFRDILKGAFLPYRSPETLNMFLHEIDGFTYDHSEDLGDAFEYLLSIMGSQGDAGQFRTPRHIIDFMVEVVEPQKNETVLDPACGTAGFLISAYKHILKNNRNKSGASLIHDERRTLHNNFTGYDISPEMVKLSRVNMFLHNFPEPKIFEYDTLSSEERWNDNFDVILANPPFMSPKGGIVPHKKFSIQATRSEVLFVDYFINHLNKKGRAGIIVPEGIIFKSENSYKQLRKNLVEDGLTAVVSLPSGVFNPYAGVKTSILFFDNQLVKKSDEVLFVKISQDGYDLGAQRRKIEKNDLPKALEILKAWKNGKKIKNDIAHWVSKKEIAKNGDYNLSGDRYRIATDYSNAKWPMVELGEVIELNRGVVYSKKDEVFENGFKILRANNISLDRELFLDDIKLISKNLKLKDNQKLKANDIFICLASGSKSHIGKVAFIKSDTDYYFGGFMGAIRIKNEKALPLYIFNLLKSQKFNDYLRQVISGANINNLNSGILSRYQIPLPTLKIQEQIVAELDDYAGIIAGAKQIAANWKPKIDIDPEWEKVKLGEVCEVFGGGTPSRTEEKYWGGNIPWLSARYFSDDHRIKGSEMITDQGLKNSSSKIAPKGSTILITRVSVGKFAIADQDYAINQDLTALVSKGKNLDSKYLWLISEIVAERVRDNAVGVGVTGVTRDFVVNQEIPLPPLAIQKQIVEKIEAERVFVEGNKKLIEIYEQKTKEAIAKLWTE